MSQQPQGKQDPGNPRIRDVRFPDLLLLATGPRAEGKGVEETAWEQTGPGSEPRSPALHLGSRCVSC